MMYRLTLAAALFCLPFSVAAQSWATKDACAVPDTQVRQAFLTPEYLAQQAAQMPNGVGKLWRITSPGGAVSHLWGTMHSTRREILDLPPKLREVIAQADYVAGEFNPILESRKAVAAGRRGEKFWVGNGPRTQTDFLRPDVKGWIKARLRGQGYQDEWFDQITIGGLASLILGDPCDDFAAGVLPIQDNYIVQLAVAAGAQIRGLEPYNRFLRDMNKPEYRETAEAVLQVYGAYLNPKGYINRDGSWYGLYLQGHMAGMMAWDKSNMVDFFGEAEGARLYGLVNGYLVGERNRGFLERALPFLEIGNTVFAVGGFHLPGDAGLVTMFRDAGYVVERVPVRGEIPPDMAH